VDNTFVFIEGRDGCSTAVQRPLHQVRYPSSAPRLAHQCISFFGTGRIHPSQRCVTPTKSHHRSSPETPSSN
jgi:hypothetical protein